MTLSDFGVAVSPQTQVRRSPIANACLFLFDRPLGSTSICRSHSLIPETFGGCNDGWLKERHPLSDPEGSGVSIKVFKVSTTSIYTFKLLTTLTAAWSVLESTVVGSSSTTQSKITSWIIAAVTRASDSRELATSLLWQFCWTPCFTFFACFRVPCSI